MDQSRGSLDVEGGGSGGSWVTRASVERWGGVGTAGSVWRFDGEVSGDFSEDVADRDGVIGEVGIEVVYARDGLEELAGVTTLGEPAGVGTVLLFARVRLAVLCARSLLTSWSSCGSMEFTYISSKTNL